jgi:hypothetical protein
MRTRIASILFALSLAAFGAGLEVLGLTDPETGRLLLLLAAVLVVASVLTFIWPKLPAWSRRSNRMALLDLRDLAAKRGWDFHSGESLHILDFVDGLQQAGLDQSLRFWGRRNLHGVVSLTEAQPLEEIQPDHWADFKIDATSLLHTEGNIHAQSNDMRGVNRERYMDLHVDGPTARRWLRREANQYKGRNG